MHRLPEDDVHWPAGSTGMADRIRSHDWAGTALGSTTSWPGELRALVELILATPLVSSIACGAERLLIYNDAAAALYGARHPRALGRPLAEIFPEGWAVVGPLYDRVFAGDSVHVPAQAVAIAGDGPRIFDAWLAPVRHRDGKVAYAHMIGFEIGARIEAERERSTAIMQLHASEERQRFLLRLSDALRPLSDPAEIQRTACRLLCDPLGAARAGYGENDPDGNSVAIIEYSAAKVPPLNARFSYAEIGEALRRAILSGQSAICSDTANEPALSPDERALRAALSIGASITLPLLKDNNPTAVLFLHYAAPHAFDADEVTLLTKVADRTWAAVQSARAQRALQASEERLRRIFEVPTVGIVFFDAHGGVLDANEAFLLLTGLSRAKLTANRPRRETLLPGAPARFDHSAPFECAFERGDGQRICILCAGMTLPDGTMMAFVIDISDRKRAEAALSIKEKSLRASEERLQTLVEGIPQLVWSSSNGGNWTWASPQWTHYTGQTLAESLEVQWLDAVHPDDREPVMARSRAAHAVGALDVDHRIRRMDGRYRWFQTRATPVRSETGDIVEWLGTSTEIDELRRYQEIQQVMVGELQHRTRNLIAVIRSIAGQTLRASASLPDFSARFNDRLEALSRVQGLLSLSDRNPVTIGALLRLEIKALGVDDDTRVLLRGPDVALPKSSVQTLALALHELATNARKYGSLAADAGRLAINWHVGREPDGRFCLTLDWREELAVPVAPAGRPARGGGYGRRLIENALPYTLGARTEWVLEPAGARCRIVLPLREGSEP